MKTVAVVGASRDRRKFGNKAVRAYLAEGHRVVPINRHEREIEGLVAYQSILDVPHPIDMVSLYVPPAEGLVVLDEVARLSVPEVWINPGAESVAVLERARALGIEPVVACSLMAVGRMPADG